MPTYTATTKDQDYTPSGVTASAQQRLDVWNGASDQKLPLFLTTGFSGWSKCAPKVLDADVGTNTTDDREIEDDESRIQYRVAHELIRRGDFVVADVRLSIAMGAEISTLTTGYSNLNSPTIKPYTPFTDEYDPNDLDAGGTAQYGAAVNGYGVMVPPGFKYWTTAGAVAQGSPGSTPGTTVPWDDASWHMAPKDLRMAWQYLVDNAGTYGFDPARMIPFGISAGGLEMLRLRKHLEMTEAQQHANQVGVPIKPLAIVALDVPARLHAMIQQNRLGSPDGITGWMGPQRSHDPASGNPSQWTDGDAAIAAPGIGDMDPHVLDTIEDWIRNPTYTNGEVPCITSFSVANQFGLEKAKNLETHDGTTSSGLTDFHAMDHGLWLKQQGLAEKVYYHDATPAGDLDADTLAFIDGALTNTASDTAELTQVLVQEIVDKAYPIEVGASPTFVQQHGAQTLATSAWTLVYAEDSSGVRDMVYLHTDGAAEVASTVSKDVEPAANNDGFPISSSAVQPTEMQGSGAIWARSTSGTPDLKRAARYRTAPRLIDKAPGAPA
jgi:hypothetical protein